MKQTFPHYHQLDSADCGPTCLRMIAKYYGRSYTLETLRERSFITREGVSMLGISDAAESIGMRSMGVKISVEQLAEDAMLPAKGIGRVKQGMTVKVMLENYPEEEFGYLTGEVLGVSDIHDKAGFYKVSIDFNNGMKTSNGFAVPSDVQMVGNAKIVIAEKRLIEKLGIFGKYH